MNLETLQYELIPVEKIVRQHFIGLPNAYCLVHFACGREIRKMSDDELEKIKKEFEVKLALAKQPEEQKEQIETCEGDGTTSIKVGNFCLILGCQPGQGVNAT